MRATTRCLMLALAVQAAACGGGGGGGAAPAPSTASPPPAASPAPSPAATPATPTDTPPATGAFGGGQGRILFAEGLNFPKTVSELDLATRQVRELAVIDPAISFALVGGVTRASDGAFLVSGHDFSEPLAKTIVYHFKADGTKLHGWIMDRTLFEGGAISPDGRLAAFAQSNAFEDLLQILVLNLDTGNVLIRNLLGSNDAPRNKSGLHAQTVWGPQGELYVLSEVGLHRVDAATGSATLLHAMTTRRPHAPLMSPDGSTIWFDQLSGNAQGGTVWSVDIPSGALTRRSERSTAGDQYAPALSPDGAWLLLQEVGFGAIAISPPLTPNPLVGSVSAPFVVSAVRRADPPLDTQTLNTTIVDAAGKGRSASGRMVWY